MRRYPRIREYGVVVVILVLILLITCGAAGLGPLRAYLVSVNIVTFFFYGFDKWQATNTSGRIPEMVLHGLALAGGTPGAFIGQIIFRHKTRKSNFRKIFILIALLQLVLLLGYVATIEP